MQAVMIERRGGGIMCGVKGWYHLSDDCETWEFICDIENDPMSSYGYPSIHFTPDSILVSYCETIGFRKFNRDEQRCMIAGFDRRELTIKKIVHEPLPMPKVK